MIFGRRANPGFRVNRATQVIVQITTFGMPRRKWRAAADSVAQPGG